MPWRTRPILAWLLAGLVAVALAYPSYWLSLYTLRELYRLFELVGLMDPRGPLGGQLLGHNFQRHPAWVHWVAGGLAAALGFAPALALSFALARRAAGRARPTLCGRCGGALRGLGEPRCPRCADPLVGRPDASWPARHVHARRFALALAAFALVHVYVTRAHTDGIRAWVVEHGQAAGCQAAHISVLVIGPEGPFWGDDVKTTAWNFAWRHGPCIAAFAAAWGAAVSAHALAGV
ncbi:MAG TPA: hypothetical protein VD963_11435, partial [Phycisphaerales bacterium]|nr:hypothetical protein [Phycisphaerales bacterium]